MGKVKKKVKVIKIDVDKCNGCRACEVICSAFHATPKFSSNNPARARIRLIHDALKDVYLPVYAGENAPAECMGRGKYVIDGKVYDECSFCRASCPSRGVFKEPDSGLPLKCDMCESDPALSEPMCVQWCLADALTYQERVEPATTSVDVENVDLSLEALANEHGWQQVIDAVNRLARKA